MNQYSDTGLEPAPVKKAAPVPTVRISDTGLENIPWPFTKSEQRLERSMTETRVRKGSVSDNGLFPTWGQVEYVEHDLMKTNGLEGYTPERLKRQIVKISEDIRGMHKGLERRMEARDRDRLARTERDFLAKGPREGSVEERMRKLLRRVAYLLTSDELRRAERAAKALDVSLFCDIAEAAWSRRPY
jgi:hypothetical protein